jgi:hypothetical protein
MERLMSMFFHDTVLTEERRVEALDTPIACEMIVLMAA